MNKTDSESNLEDCEWAKETKRWKVVPRPYPFKESVIFLKNWVLGPSKKYRGSAEFIPKTCLVNEITPKIKLGFIGDIMRMAKNKLVIDNSIKEFFKDIDYLIGNFEGIITTKNKRGAVGSQILAESDLEAIKEFLPPEKILLSYSNNHAGDFGWEEFQKSYKIVKDHGFMVIGRRDEPAILLDNKVNIGVASFLSDQRCSFISDKEELTNYYNKNAKFNILYPHWGFELQYYPWPDQVDLANKLLNTWDLILGNHAHTPQPVSIYPTTKGNKVVAYSLGNFCYGLKWKKYHHNGLIVKTEIGPNKESVWQTGNLSWDFIQVFFEKQKQVRVTIIDDYKHFKNL
ncbi:MAG: CapA family protein [Candidatus Heimdallarchaeota archaeon]|nr:CapA family protein [Candidatus Heimdallarchaeota archaeon]MBY8994242.1 CapA family protein [Candidatus Heimdallarchaeota archaeon]